MSAKQKGFGSEVTPSRIRAQRGPETDNYRFVLVPLQEATRPCAQVFMGLEYDEKAAPRLL